MCQRQCEQEKESQAIGKLGQSKKNGNKTGTRMNARVRTTIKKKRRQTKYVIRNKWDRQGKKIEAMANAKAR